MDDVDHFLVFPQMFDLKADFAIFHVKGGFKCDLLTVTHGQKIIHLISIEKKNGKSKTKNEQGFHKTS
jgi:hypothetical protein